MATHDDSDYSVIDKAGMVLGHASAGLVLPGIDETTRTEATRLCARDHLEHHVFFNNRGFHNHLNHHLLSVFSMGAPAPRLQEVFDLNRPMQRPPYPLESNNVAMTASNYHEYFSDERHYPAYVAFFKDELERAGHGWKQRAGQYFLDSKVLPLGMGGLFHPLIQLGYGLEFESKAITATALAQACVHQPTFQSLFTSNVFADMCTTPAANGGHGVSLMQLLDLIRSDATIADMPFESSRVPGDIRATAAEKLAAKYAAMWAVPPTKESIAAKYHELLSVTALFYGSLTRPGYTQLLHFLVMHCLTSAYFLPVIFDCMPVVCQAALLKAQSAAVLFFFVRINAPELHIPPELTAIDTHKCVSDDAGPQVTNPWLGVFEQAIASNDMHVSKVVRSLWRGSLLDAFAAKQATTDGYELPPQINWLYLARVTTSTITASSFEDAEAQFKEGKRSWVFGMVGHDEFWATYPTE